MLGAQYVLMSCLHLRSDHVFLKVALWIFHRSQTVLSYMNKSIGSDELLKVYDSTSCKAFTQNSVYDFRALSKKGKNKATPLGAQAVAEREGDLISPLELLDNLSVQDVQDDFTAVCTVINNAHGKSVASSLAMSRNPVARMMAESVFATEFENLPVNSIARTKERRVPLMLIEYHYFAKHLRVEAYDNSIAGEVRGALVALMHLFSNTRASNDDVQRPYFRFPDDIPGATELKNNIWKANITSALASNRPLDTAKTVASAVKQVWKAAAPLMRVDIDDEKSPIDEDMYYAMTEFLAMASIHFSRRELRLEGLKTPFVVDFNKDDYDFLLTENVDAVTTLQDEGTIWTQNNVLKWRDVDINEVLESVKTSSKGPATQKQTAKAKSKSSKTATASKDDASSSLHPSSSKASTSKTAASSAKASTSKAAERARSSTARLVPSLTTVQKSLQHVRHINHSVYLPTC
jgi:hypothetical protein